MGGAISFAFYFVSYDLTTGNWKTSDLLEKLRAEKKSANELQLRKHPDWNENYELYRNRVKTNRLTQRQAVNIPLMKETIKTILSKIDDPPNIEWKELGGDEEKEIVYQEVWDDNSRKKKLELVDVLDKKNVLLYGLSTKVLNPVEDGIDIDVLDIYDVVFDPLMSSSDVETARFVIRQNIFRTIREILADKRYTEEGKKNLMVWSDSSPGITQGQKNKEEWERKMERLRDMGVSHNDFAKFAGGDRIINLSEHFTREWNKEKKEWERRVVVYADDSVELLNESLKDIIGVEFWPFVVWSEDPETNDIYCDSVADLIRTPNKVVNVWYSQMIENRTLKNFQMHWFLPMQGYSPTTYQPGPGVMLPAPPGDDVNKVIKPVEISGLDDTLTAINAITQIAERGSGATAIEKGEPEKGTQTLGEVEILVGKAMERTIGIAKFYRMAWYELAWKWDKMMHANKPKYLKLYKQSQNGKIYPKRVYTGDWASDVGYEPIVRSSSEQEQDTLKELQKFSFIVQQFPNNSALRKISQSRMLDSLNLTPEELKSIEDAEKQLELQPQMQQEQDVSAVQNSLQQLQNLNAA